MSLSARPDLPLTRANWWPGREAAAGRRAAASAVGRDCNDLATFVSGA